MYPTPTARDRTSAATPPPVTSPMDCSAFQRHHLAFVDDTLPGDLVVAAVRHVAECPACARHDAAVRRSLLLARNVCGGDRLECSSDFTARLEARLRALPVERPAADDWAPRWWEAAPLATQLGAQIGERLSGRRTRQALAAAAVLAAVSAGAALRGGATGVQVQGLGTGVLAAEPFTSPFAATSAGAFADLSTGPWPAEGAARGDEDGGGAAFVVNAEAVDAGAVVAPAAVGVPVWAAAVLAGEMPAVLWREAGAQSVQLIRVGY